MKFPRSLFICLAFSATLTAALAAAPSTNAPAGTPPQAKKTAKKTTATNKAADKTPATSEKTPPPAAAQAPAPATPATQPAAKKEFTLADYLQDLKGELKLSDAEQQQVEASYVQDGPALQKILNDGSLSPMQQSQQVDDLRRARNAKIESLLNGLDRSNTFLSLEAKYRVALLELAANGALVAPPPDKSASK